jgi:DNA-binding GntR family transcriptional regulator
VTEQLARRINLILRSRIGDGTWPPGHIFTWSELAEEFSLTGWEVGLHLAPVLRGLRRDGLIETRPRIGSRVVISGESWSPPSEYSDLPHDEYIETVIRKRLSENYYTPGGQFTPIMDLAEEFGVSMATVRKAKKTLLDQGILISAGNRTFVSPNLRNISKGDLLLQPTRDRPGHRRLEAFGESHTIAEWARDARCVVDRPVLYNRYIMGWDLETALRIPKSQILKQAPGNVSEPIELTTHSEYDIARIFVLERIHDGTYSRGTVIASTDIALRTELGEESILDALKDLHDIEILAHRAGIGYFVAVSRNSLGENA